MIKLLLITYKKSFKCQTNHVTISTIPYQRDLLVLATWLPLWSWYSIVLFGFNTLIEEEEAWMESSRHVMCMVRSSFETDITYSYRPNKCKMASTYSTWRSKFKALYVISPLQVQQLLHTILLCLSCIVSLCLCIFHDSHPANPHGQILQLFFSFFLIPPFTFSSLFSSRLVGQ